jgi:hypothetical protein
MGKVALALVDLPDYIKTVNEFINDFKKYD